MHLPDAIRQLLTQGLGVRGPGQTVGSIDDVRLPSVRLADDVLTRLRSVLGGEHARSDHESRVRHMRGKSTPDLLRLRAGDVQGAPDVVLSPESHEQVLELLRICSEERVAVVPFGGGTSVVGGLEPDASSFAGVAAIDLRRMNALLELDEESRLAVFEPGLRGPEAEALLAARGYTIGHFPQSYEYATLGGAAAARSSGQSSAGYGRFDELVAALRVATPAGSLSLGRAPKSAAGPDLRQLILGSEGALGVITALTVRIRPLPVATGLRGLAAAVVCGRGRRRQAARPGRSAPDRAAALRRGRDRAEPGAARRTSGRAGAGGCLAIVGYEGTAEDVASRRTGGLGGAARGRRRAGGSRRRRGLGPRALPRPVPARRAARCRRDRRDARDGDVLVVAARTVRGGLHGAARIADRGRARRR